MVGDCYSIHFFSVEEGLLIANSGHQLFRTSDGGNTWEEKAVPSMSTDDDLRYFSFTHSNPEFGYIATLQITNEGFLLPYTNDRGITWKSRQIEPHHVSYPINLAFKTPSVGLGVFDFNEAVPFFIYGTIDSGKNWIQRDSEGSGIIRPPGNGYSVSLAYLSDGEWISGYYDFVNDRTTFYKSRDDGMSWDVSSIINNDEVYSIIFFDSIGYASLSGRIAKSTNFGNSWSKANNPYIGFISHFSIPTSDVAYAISYEAILKTTRTNKVEEQNVHHELNTTPNPTQDYLTLNFEATPSQELLEVFDALGRQVSKEIIPANTNSYTLDIRRYASGAYYVRYRNKTARFVKF
jgi:photosystem II stability/assembly factor-like uncharacterized protein